MVDTPRAHWPARLKPLLLISCLMVLAATGCTPANKNGSIAASLKKSAVESAKLTEPEGNQEGELSLDDFLSDPLAEGGDIVPGGSSKAFVHKVMKTAFSQVGNPYRYGGSKPETGFDCSGFVKWVYGQNDIKLPRSSGDMLASGSSVNRKELRPGDLVFFGKKKRITHVGIYTGDNKYIHSPRTGKRIQESSLDDRSRGEYYVGARRLIDNKGVSSIHDSLKLAWVPKNRQQYLNEKSDKVSTRVAAAKASQKSSSKTTQTAAKKTETSTKTAKKSDTKTVQTASAKKTGQSDKTASAKKNEESKAVAVAKAEPAEKPVQTADAGSQAAEPVAAAPAASADEQVAVQTAKIEIQPAPQQVKTAEAKPAAAKPAAAKSNAKATKHKVASGDTLYALARKYGVTADAIAKANNLQGKQVAVLKLGQTLVVPPKTKTN